MRPSKPVVHALLFAPLCLALSVPISGCAERPGPKKESAKKKAEAKKRREGKKGADKNLSPRAKPGDAAAKDDKPASPKTGEAAKGPAAAPSEKPASGASKE